MEKMNIEDFCEQLEVMTITRSIDHGFAIVHFGHIAGTPTVAISTCRGDGDCYIIQ